MHDIFRDFYRQCMLHSNDLAFPTNLSQILKKLSPHDRNALERGEKTHDLPLAMHIEVLNTFPTFYGYQVAYMQTFGDLENPYFKILRILIEHDLLNETTFSNLNDLSHSAIYLGLSELITRLSFNERREALSWVFDAPLAPKNALTLYRIKEVKELYHAQEYNNTQRQMIKTMLRCASTYPQLVQIKKAVLISEDTLQKLLELPQEPADIFAAIINDVVLTDGHTPELIRDICMIHRLCPVHNAHELRWIYKVLTAFYAYSHDNPREPSCNIATCLYHRLAASATWGTLLTHLTHPQELIHAMYKTSLLDDTVHLRLLQAAGHDLQSMSSIMLWLHDQNLLNSQRFVDLLSTSTRPSFIAAYLTYLAPSPATHALETYNNLFIANRIDCIAPPITQIQHAFMQEKKFDAMKRMMPLICRCIERMPMEEQLMRNESDCTPAPLRIFSHAIIHIIKTSSPDNIIERITRYLAPNENATNNTQERATELADDANTSSASAASVAVVGEELPSASAQVFVHDINNHSSSSASATVAVTEDAPCAATRSFSWFDTVTGWLPQLQQTLETPKPLHHPFFARDCARLVPPAHTQRHLERTRQELEADLLTGPDTERMYPL